MPANLDNTLHDEEVDYSRWKTARISTHEGRTLLPQTPAGSLFFEIRKYHTCSMSKRKITRAPVKYSGVTLLLFSQSIFTTSSTQIINNKYYIKSRTRHFLKVWQYQGTTFVTIYLPWPIKSWATNSKTWWRKSNLYITISLYMKVYAGWKVCALLPQQLLMQIWKNWSLHVCWTRKVMIIFYIGNNSST